jgi:hypothetical protein
MLLSRAVSRYAGTAGTKHAYVRPAKVSLAPRSKHTLTHAPSNITRPLRAATEETTASSDAEDEGYGLAPCAPAFVVADNSHPHYTQFSIDVSRHAAIIQT